MRTAKSIRLDFWRVGFAVAVVVVVVTAPVVRAGVVVVVVVVVVAVVVVVTLLLSLTGTDEVNVIRVALVEGGSE